MGVGSSLLRQQPPFFLADDLELKAELLRARR